MRQTGALIAWLVELLPRVVKAIAEGDPKNPLTRLYWWASGKKTYTALGMALLYGIGLVAVNVFGQCVPECATQASVEAAAMYLSYVPWIAGVLGSIGLFDKAIKLEPPKKK